MNNLVDAFAQFIHEIRRSLSLRQFDRLFILKNKIQHQTQTQLCCLGYSLKANLIVNMFDAQHVNLTNFCVLKQSCIETFVHKALGLFNQRTDVLFAFQSRNIKLVNSKLKRAFKISKPISFQFFGNIKNKKGEFSLALCTMCLNIAMNYIK